MKTRIFFSADIHGSTLVWKKWIKASEVYQANVLILSGDLTGKVLVPIIEHENGTWSAKYFGRRWVIESKEGLREFENRLEDSGVYYIEVDKSELEEMKNDQNKVYEMMNKKIEERLREWLELLANEVTKRDFMAIVYPGNDDELFIDNILKEYTKYGIIFPERGYTEIGKHEAIFSPYVNPTPWNTPREMEEDRLMKYLEELISSINNVGNSLFVIHPPPYGTQLDLAPQLTADLKPVVIGGSVQYQHVGSLAVRRMIEKNQPLVGLHGHIHESSGSEMIGKTLTVNPGSEYSEGILRGFIVDLDTTSIEKYWRVEG
ncbi:MAG: metallophosphoesterase family protein [Fervidicoccaceae archaeon]|jgi:Icc-related predicted phosphoesterase